MTVGSNEYCGWLRRWWSLLAVALVANLAGCAVADQATNSTQSTDIRLQSDNQHYVDIRVWPPQQPCDPCDAVVFSHGHGLGHDQYDVLLQEWANAGYLILAPLHVDSEQHPDRTRYSSNQYLGLRLLDFRTIVEWLGSDSAELISGINLSTRYLAAGHSFGALIAQMAGGATVEHNGRTVRMALASPPNGVVAVSPPGPVDGYLSTHGWRQIHSPLLVVTGTEDVVPLFAPTWQAHLASFHAGPSRNSVALTFAGMDHYFNGAFGRLRVIDADAEFAVKALNRAILRFADALREGVPLSEVVWPDVGSEAVRIETR